MSLKPFHYHCRETVSFEYFNENRPCSPEIVAEALRKIYEDYSDYYVYLGITENPCGRFSGNYMVNALPFDIRLEVPISLYDAIMLDERSHSEDYEKMFVICYAENEKDIRDMEAKAIKSGEGIDSDRTLNLTLGRNGNVKPGRNFYFLYACITLTIPLED